MQKKNYSDFTMIISLIFKLSYSLSCCSLGVCEIKLYKRNPFNIMKGFLLFPFSAIPFSWIGALSLFFLNYLQIFVFWIKGFNFY